MEKNANVYKKVVEKEGKKYVNFFLDVNGFEVCFKPQFLNKKQYRAFVYHCPLKEVK